MKKTIGLALMLGISMPTFAAEYLVKYRSSYALQTFSSNQLMQIRDVHDAGQLMKVNIPETNKVNAMVQLVTDPNVEYVVPNARVRAFYAPLDMDAMANLKQQWSIGKVQAEKAWKLAGNKGSKKVTVAVIDTGVDSKHESLAPNMIAGYDFAGNDADPMDEVGQNPGHGTHCAGAVGATGLKDGGIIGLSPEVSMMPIRFLDKNGGGDLNNAIKAIDFAIEKKADIISASWGATIPRPQAQPLIEAIERAEKAGIIFVVAAANDGKNNDRTDVFPANAGLANTISVAASDSNDRKPSWSNYGKATVHVSAPGNEIMSTLPNNKYGNLSGTSMATPLVAGLVALVKAQDPNLTPVQIRSLLQASGAKVAIETACDCRVDALGAVEIVKGKKMFVSPHAGTYAVGETVQFEGVYGQGPFDYSSSNTTVASIDNQGRLSALAEGTTQITVKDSKGNTATSYNINIGKAAASNPPGGGGGGGGGGAPGLPGDGSCPLGDEQLCQIICQISPELPWCSQ